MLEPKGDRKSCSQIKTVAPNKISDQNSCLPPPCKSPTHHHHPFAHSSCLPLSCESPPPAPPLAISCLPPYPVAHSYSPGNFLQEFNWGGICDEVSSCPLISSPRCKMPHPRYKFLPHLLMPSVPPLIANPPTTPSANSRPPLRIPPLANPPASKSSCPSPAPFSANPCLPYPLFPNMRP